MPKPMEDSIHRATLVREIREIPRTYGGERTCDEPGCATRLSRYNPRGRCWQHQPASPFVLRPDRKRNDPLPKIDVIPS